MKRILIALLLLTTPAIAQVHRPALTGDLAKDLQTNFANATGRTAGQPNDPLVQLIDKFNADLNADLTNALALASQKDPNGNVADSTAIPCYQAILTLNSLINGLAVPITPANTPANLDAITHFEKLRILKNALGNQNFKDACAPLIQDIQSTAGQLLASVLGIVGGAAKLGIAIP